MSEFTTPNLSGYFGFCLTSFSQTLRRTLWRKQIFLVVGIAILPVIIPFLVYFFGPEHGDRFGQRFLVRVVQHIYALTFGPLIALFYATMLVGEDVESQTLPYLLTRPVPRSAWIIGRFLAYVLVGTLVLGIPVILIYLTCVGFDWIEMTGESMKLLAHYEGVILMAIMGYGGVCLLFGAMVKRPIIWGLVFVFGWQKLAIYLPGVIDFLTIEKHIRAMLPDTGGRRNSTIEVAMFQFQKQEFILDAVQSVYMILAISAVMIVLTTLVVRFREYSAAKAIQV